MSFASGMLQSAGCLFRRIFFLDLRMLACFRMGLGTITLIDLYQRVTSFEAHYGLHGCLPPAEAPWFANFISLLPIHCWAVSDSAQILIFVIHALAAVALILGFQTRWTVVICWLLLNSLHLRNPILLYGADRELAVLFLWAMLLPLGARWSVDNRQKCQWLGKDRVEGWACAGLILQVGLIYFTSVFSKSGETWRDGTAVELAFHLDIYTRDLGRALLEYPTLMKVLTYSTLAIEWIAPLLLLGGRHKKLRLLGCGLLIGMQCGFLVCFHLGLFPWVSMLALIALIPATKTESPSNRREALQSPMPWNNTLSALLVTMMLSWHATLIAMPFSQNTLLSKMPTPLSWSFKVTRLAQSWSMFSPDPPETDGWFILAYDAEGPMPPVDLWRRSAPVAWSKPKQMENMFPSERWKEWILKIHTRGLRWEHTIDYLIRNHEEKHENTSHKTGSQVELWYLEETLKKPGAGAEKHLLFQKKYP
ncbi:MAG: HTTM domain-containing protein [Verrucomicrobiota bacterium]|nr:HTTM domain-containing protein [Verrucomicrobiota bacterium]